MIEEKPLPWQELVETFFRRRWTILVLAAIGLAAAGVVAALTPPNYRAAARIQLSDKALADPREAAMLTRQIQAEVAALQNPNLVRAVLAEYEESGHPPEPETSPLAQIRSFFGGGDEAEAGRPMALAGELDSASIKSSNYIEVSYTGSDPQWAADFVNDLLEHHKRRIADQSDLRKSESIYKQEGNVRFDEWQEAREALAVYREEHGASVLAIDEDNLRKALSNLESQRISTQTEVLEMLAKIEFIEQEKLEYPELIEAESVVIENEAVTFLDSRILDLEMQRSEALSRYTPTSVTVRNIDRQIEEARRLLASKERETLAEVRTQLNPARQALELDLVDTRGRLSSAEARVSALSQQIEGYRLQLVRLETTGADLGRLQADSENAKLSYQDYSRKEEEARFSSSLYESGIININTTDVAQAPAKPEPSGNPTLIGMGTGAGLLLGVLLAFLKDWVLDPSVKGSAQAHRLSGLPVIAEIS